MLATVIASLAIVASRAISMRPVRWVATIGPMVMVSQTGILANVRRSCLIARQKAVPRVCNVGIVRLTILLVGMNLGVTTFATRI